MINEEKPSTWYHSFSCFSIKSNFSFHVQFQKEGLLINLPNQVLNNCTKNIWKSPVHTQCVSYKISFIDQPVIHVMVINRYCTLKYKLSKLFIISFFDVRERERERSFLMLERERESFKAFIEHFPKHKFHIQLRTFNFPLMFDRLRVECYEWTKIFLITDRWHSDFLGELVEIHKTEACEDWDERLTLIWPCSLKILNLLRDSRNWPDHAKYFMILKMKPNAGCSLSSLILYHLKKSEIKLLHLILWMTFLTLNQAYAN